MVWDAVEQVSMVGGVTYVSEDAGHGVWERTGLAGRADFETLLLVSLFLTLTHSLSLSLSFSLSPRETARDN